MSDRQDDALGDVAALAAAYGADRRRWPAAGRAAAERAAGGRDGELRAVLAREDRLDAWLDAYRLPGPSAALADRVLALAPRPAQLWSRAVLWWSGLGLAGTGLAGAATGALALSLANPAPLDQQADVWSEGQTIFGEFELQGTADG